MRRTVAADDLAAGTDTTDAFAYATRGDRTVGSPGRITIITSAELTAFMISHPELMTNPHPNVDALLWRRR